MRARGANIQHAATKVTNMAYFILSVLPPCLRQTRILLLTLWRFQEFCSERIRLGFLPELSHQS